MVAWLIIMVVECVEEILYLMTDKQTGRKEGVGRKRTDKIRALDSLPVPTS